MIKVFTWFKALIMFFIIICILIPAMVLSIIGWVLTYISDLVLDWITNTANNERENLNKIF